MILFHRLSIFILIFFQPLQFQIEFGEALI